jgi:hypothetical protein
MSKRNLALPRVASNTTLKRLLPTLAFALSVSLSLQTLFRVSPVFAESRDAQGAAARKIESVEGLDIRALIREVAASERANNRNAVDYTYTSTTTERETENGRVTKERVTVAEVYPQYGESVRKIISRDGVTLSTEDSDREFKRAVEAFKKNEQETAKRREEAAKQAAKQTTPTQAPPDKNAIPSFGPVWGFSYRSGLSSGSFTLSLSNFLHAAEFYAPRLERFRERDAVVLDFRPRADFAPASDAQKPYAKLAGRIWIDAADRQIMRVEARPVADALKKKGDATATSNEPWIVIEQTRLPDGRWKESLIRLNTTADKSIFNGIERDYTETMSDFRRFTTTGEDKVAPPDEESSIVNRKS